VETKEALAVADHLRGVARVDLVVDPAAGLDRAD